MRLCFQLYFTITVLQMKNGLGNQFATVPTTEIMDDSCGSLYFMKQKRFTMNQHLHSSGGTQGVSP